MAQPEVYDRVVGVGVDMINAFFPPDGALPVPKGDEVVDPFNAVGRWIRGQGGAMVFVNDEHPAKTSHFSDPPDFKTTWPPHAVVGTYGAKFRPDLEVTVADIIMQKGTEQDEDAYSGFQAATREGVMLKDILSPQWPGERVAMIMGGLATDYCDKATGIDGVEFAKTIQPEAGRLGVYALLDAMRPVHLETGAAALRTMEAAGVQLITSEDLIAGNVIQLK